jgi:hypothetical protein
MAYQERGSGPPHFDGKNYQMWSKRMAAFLRGKGQILWDVTVDTSYVQPMNFLFRGTGSRDMFDANNKAVDYLFRALCHPEFDRVHTEHLACRIWSLLMEAHVGNAQVQARMYATYQREYENFTHLPGESIDALFKRFTVVVNNMRANADVLRTMIMIEPSNSYTRWIVRFGVESSRPLWSRRSMTPDRERAVLEAQVG